MENKKEKWEEIYESYMNGDLDKKLEELNSKHKNKEIDIKEFLKEQKRLEKIKSNLPKVANLVGLKEELEDLKAELENEFLRRDDETRKLKDEENLNKQIEKSDKELEQLMIKIDDTKQKLKNNTLSDEDRKKLEDQLNKDEAKLKTNNEKFLDLNQKRNKSKQNIIEDKSEITQMSKEDLKKSYQKICIRISKTNLYAKRLLKGYDLETIKTIDEGIDWKNRKYKIDMKELRARGKNAEKLKSLKETTKEKVASKEMEKVEKELGKNVSSIIDKNEAIEKQNEKQPEEEKAMIEVSEFDRKHPRLAKIKNWFKKFKDLLLEDDEIEDYESEKDKKSEEESKAKKGAQKESKTEEKQESKENQMPVKENKREKFVATLKNLEEYEVFDIAEKGLDGLKEEKIAQARKQLLENKKNARGDVDQKSYSNLEAQAKSDEEAR